MAKRRRNIKSTKITVIIIVLIIFIALIATIKDSQWKEIFQDVGVVDTISENDKFSVSFVDVGQGDCTVIHSKKDGTIIIDSGEKDQFQSVSNYLDSLGVEKIDYCIVTHPHSDHMGSMAKVLEKYGAGVILMPELTEENMPTTYTYEKFLLAADKYADEAYEITARQSYELGDIKFTVLGPISQNEDLNNMSLVVRVDYGKTSFLITGDCSFEEENEIMDKYYSYLDSDVLKIGHHGSSGSTGKKWLKAISPESAVICVGEGNSYGHPTNKVLSLLEKNNIKYYRTDLEGTIVFQSDGKAITKN